MRFFQQHESAAAGREVFVQMVDAADGVGPRTGLSLTVQLVKAGGSAYEDIAGSWSEIGSGTYRIRLAAADLDTVGEAMLKITAAGALPQYVPIRVSRIPDEVHLAKAALLNRRTHTIDTAVNRIYDDDGVTLLRTLTPAEAEGVVTLTPS